jgi:hypothetical protein
MRRHDGSSDGEIGYQLSGAGERDLPIMLKILEGGNRILKVQHDPVANMALNTMPNHEQAHRSKACRN